MCGENSVPYRSWPRVGVGGVFPCWESRIPVLPKQRKLAAFLASSGTKDLRLKFGGERSADLI